MAVITSASPLGAFQKEGKRATLDVLAQTPQSRSQHGEGHLLLGAVQPAIPVSATVSQAVLFPTFFFLPASF